VTYARDDQGRPIGIDVVHLGRLDRMHDELGPLLEARLWHPGERLAAAGMSAADRRRYLAASLAVKEAWIKSVGRRPPGWVFSDASLLLGAAAPRDAEAVTAGLTTAFAQDLGTATTEAGCLHADQRNGSQAPPGGQPACYGIHGDWLIAGISS
jgi:phosphopantetheine--protein transferase-like protein